MSIAEVSISNHLSREKRIYRAITKYKRLLNEHRVNKALKAPKYTQIVYTYAVNKNTLRRRILKISKA